MRFLTDFADGAVVLPALGLACTALLLMGWRRAALVLFGAVVAVGAIVTAGKFLFLACPALAANGVGLHSPSGHTAMAVALYGGLAALLLAGRRALWRTVPPAILVAGAVGSSRLALGFHSAADVAAGTAIGMAGACAVALAAGTRPTRALRRWEVLPVAVSLAFLFHGQHLRAEELLKDYAARLSPPPACRGHAEGGAGSARPDMDGRVAALPASH